MSLKKTIKPGVRFGVALPMIRVDGIDYDLSVMTKDELIDLHFDIEIVKSDVDHVFELGKNDSSGGGGMASNRFVRRTLGIQSQAIQNELTKRKEERRGIESVFIDVARGMLRPDVFKAILGEAAHLIASRREE